MTFRLPMIAAVLLLSSSVAQASDLTSSTDGARARAAVTSGAGAAAPVTAASRTPASTDEARALVAGGLRTVTRPAGQAAVSACTCQHG